MSGSVYVPDWVPPGVDLSREMEVAAWLIRALEPRGLDRLSTFLPGGFAAYARIFHPVVHRSGRYGELDVPAAVRWRDLAADRGIDLFRDITFPEVAGPDAGSGDLAPLTPSAGTLPPETCVELTSILARNTSTPGTTWLCLWDGNGFFWSTSHGYGEVSGVELEHLRARAREQDDLLSSFPRVDTGIRRYFLCRGPLSAACAFHETIGATPNLWWPDDRRWVVLTEVDSYSTYVGGTATLVSELLGHPEIEAIEVDLDALVDPGI